MVIYVSAATKAQGGIYADPKYVVDPSISTDPTMSQGTPVTTQQVQQQAAPKPAPAPATQDVLGQQLYVSSYTGLPLSTVQANWNTGNNFAEKLGVSQPAPAAVPMMSMVPKSQSIQVQSPYIPLGATVTNAQSLVGGGTSISYTQPNIQPFQQEQLSPTQKKIIEAGAFIESLPIVSNLYSRYYQSQQEIKQNPNDWLGNIGREVGGGALITIPETAKAVVATGGIYAAAIKGDAQAFQQGVPSSQKAFIGAATDPSFYIKTAVGLAIMSPMVGKGGGGAAGRGIGIAELRENVVEGGSYKGFYVGDQPLIGLKTEAGSSRIVAGTPKFETATPKIFERVGEASKVNVAETFNLAERGVYSTLMKDYLTKQSKPALLERYTLSEKAGSASYYTEIPFTKTISAVKELPAIKGQTPLVQENIVGYLKSTKGEVQQVYGSFSADVRGALPRAAGDVDIQLKTGRSGVEYGTGMVEAIRRGGGEAKVVGQTVNIKVGTDYVKAFDIHGFEQMQETALPVGGGEGIGFGLAPKGAVFQEGIPYMASGEQTVRVGSSVSSFLRRGSEGELQLAPSLANVKRTGDFIALVEKSAQVSGNKKYANFGEQFQKFLTPEELKFMEKPTPVKVKIFEAGKESPLSVSPMSFVSSKSYSFQPSTTISSISIQPSKSQSFSQSVSSFSVSAPSASLPSFISYQPSSPIFSPPSVPQYSPPSSPPYSPPSSPIYSPPSSPPSSPPYSPPSIPPYSPPSSPPYSPPSSPPYSPPSIPPQSPPSMPPFTPPLFGGFGDLGGFEFGKKSKGQKGKYQPSFAAIQLNIRGAKGKSEIFGFAFRPIASSGKKGSSKFGVSSVFKKRR